MGCVLCCGLWLKGDGERGEVCSCISGVCKRSLKLQFATQLPWYRVYDNVHVKEVECVDCSP